MGLKPALAVGPWLYGALFVVVLPLALVAWAVAAAPNVTLPGVLAPRAGSALLGMGVLLWASGAMALRLQGGGLPMNAFPPPRLVTTGAYALLGHPLYVGATLGAAGVALLTGSAAGLWLVTPALGLGAAALWWGYERADLQARLGSAPRAPALGVPLARDDVPLFRERVGALGLVVGTVALAALVLHASGLAGRAAWVVAGPSGRVGWAVGAVVVAVGAARAVAGLRELVLCTLLGTLVVGALFLMLPGGPFHGHLPLAADGALLSLLAMAGVWVAAGRRTRWSRAVRPGLALVLGAFLASGGALPALESALGGLAFVVGAERRLVWRVVLRGCEWVANCWGEHDFGAVRVLHIGWLAALPAMGAAALAVVLLGPGSGVMVTAALVSVLVGSALWAQTIEGSPALSRPYGFFGGVLAALAFAGLAAPLVFHVSPWLVVGAWAVVAPWAQGLARLRCFANGCCHGAPCAAELGVVYRHPRTRVVRLANLGGVPIHPTQLYSMLGNAAVGAVTTRLWAEGAPLALVGGVYFVLMGLARFVEEAWRGEPQTPSYAGLRLYQWVAVGCVVVGAAMTGVGGTPAAPLPQPTVTAGWTGMVVGAVVWLATSVDFPRSRRRFARLA